MSQETWQCPTCAQSIPVSERVCPTCKVTQIRRRPADEEEAHFLTDTVEITLPHAIPEARFNVPTQTGAEWASGILLFSGAGIFLLSSKDGLSPDQVIQDAPSAPGRIGERSFFAPVGMVKRIVNSRLSGQFLELEGKKIPLRLDAPGWKALDAVCQKLGIARS
jgi:hypothetical protein